MSLTPRVYRTTVIAEPGDIDALGHVNNVVYLRWVQEVAGAHWFAAAPPEAQQALAWVVTRHEIDYRAPALLGDRITARTWVGAWSGVTSDRHVEFHHAETGRLLAKARTIWCAIDPATGRPKRFDQALVSAFQTESGGDAGTIASES